MSECASCGFDNRLGALFCGSCGARLGRACASCGEIVPVGHAFCTACGAAATPVPTAPPIAEERKVVTVLFADLVGFTSRAERLDPEDVRRMLSPFHARVKAELESYGGTVEKFIGDAVVALFGAPLVREDDPERGVRAALAVCEAIGELNAADPELGLNVRVGVTTGEAMIALGARPSQGEGMAAGDVVNTCSRLQSAAPVNGILVDGATYRATRNAIEYREAEPVIAKGKAEPLEVWEVVAPRTRLGIDIAFRGGAELVGRDEELRMLREALGRAERERAPKLVTLVGPPGIGKSRLLYELYAALRSDPGVFAHWLQGRSLPYGEGVSFWAAGEMVKAQAGILESDDAGDADAKIRDAVALAVGDAGEAEWVETHLRPLVGLAGTPDPGADPRPESFAAWRRFFEALAERRTLVLVFEDLHWGDDGLLDFVDHLVDWATGVPLLVVCTARPELFERRPDWGGGKRNALTISLSPLSDEDTTRLLAALLAEKDVSGGETAELLAHAGGNPLYAEEYVRMLATRDRAAGLPLPETVQGIIAARLDTLPPEEKALLQDAAVVGKVFWTGGLAAVSGRSPAAVERDVLRLERKEFVRRERRSSVAGETAYVFRHVLVRDVAYGQIPRSRRAESHRRAAEWLESLAGDRAEDVADLLAHHYLSALQFGRASRRDLGGLRERARLALADAGDRALALAAYAPAVRFYREALAAWPDGDPARPRLLLRYGHALFRAEETGADTLAEAAAELLAAGEVELAAEAEVLLADLALVAEGRREKSVEHLERAVAMLDDAPPSRAKAYVTAHRARFHLMANEADRAAAAGADAHRMAEELGLDDVLEHALSTIGTARVMSGDLGGLEDLTRSIELARRANSPHAARNYSNLASVVAELGDLERAFEVYAEGRHVARRFGDAPALAWLAVEQMYEHYWRGEWDAARAESERFIADESATPTLRDVDGRLIRAKIRLASDDIEGASDDAVRALALSRSVGAPQVLFPALALQAEALTAAGERDEAIASARELNELWSGRAGPALGSFWVSDLAFTVAELGCAEELAEAVTRARTETRWLEAAAAVADGDWLRAVEIFAAIGARPEEARARLFAAEDLVSAGRTGDADAQLGAALAFYGEVGAARYVGRAERLLAGGPTRPGRAS